MNKLVKIILAVIGVIVIGAVCSFIFFSGCIAKLLISHDKESYPNINQTVGEYGHYGEKVPDSFGEVSALGISLRLPEDIKRKSDDPNDRKYYLFESGTDSLSVKFVRSTSLWNYSRYMFLLDIESEDEIKKELSCCKDGDIELNNYELTAFLRNFTPDSLKTRGKGVIITALKNANEKRAACDYEQSWNYENYDAVGFVDYNGCEDGIYSYNLILYDKNDLNAVYCVMLKSSSEELIWQIIDSSELKTE